MYRSFEWLLLCAVGVLSVVAVARAQSAMDAAARARELGKEAPPIEALQPTDRQREDARALAEEARRRGREALQERIATEGLSSHDESSRKASNAASNTSGKAPTETVRAQTSTEEGEGARRDPLEGRLIVALSSSMPSTMVHDYMVQLAGVPEAVVVLRGFVGGAHTVAPTGKWVEEVRRVVPGCLRCEHYNVEVVVDPLVYRALKIEKVPAVAYAPGISDLSHCDGKDLKVSGVVYGAVSVEAAVRTLTVMREGGEVPGALLEKVRRKGWEQRAPKHTGS